MSELTPLQREILSCLRDNNGTMKFEDMTFDLRPHTSPQGLGRNLTALAGLRLVDRFRSWDNDESVSITSAGEVALGDGQ